MEIKTKGIDNTEYMLEHSNAFFEPIDDKFMPEQKIISLRTIGIGIRLNMRRNSLIMENNDIIFEEDIGNAVIKEIKHENDRMIIYAEEKTYKKDKLKFVEKIIDEIDLKQGVSKESFINMFSNVFSEKMLNKILEQDKIEMLSFEGLTYLKVDDKAYRL